MVEFQENPLLASLLEEELGTAMRGAAQGAKNGLQWKLAAGSAPRTGKKYRKYPRVSSAPGEYPQMQSGELRMNVDAVEVSPLEHNVGIFGEDPDKLMYLEYTGDVARGGIGVRRPLYMFFEGTDTNYSWNHMAKSIRKALKGSR